MMTAMRHSRWDVDVDGDGTHSIGSEWEPEPFELPLLIPEPRAPRRDDADADAFDEEPRSRVIIIDLT